MLRQGTNNGFATLAHIDMQLQNTRQQLHEVEGKAERSSQELATLNNRESSVYADLAAIQLGRLDNADALRTQLSAAERRASELLGERDQAIAKLVTETELSLKTQTELETARETDARRIEEKSETLHELVEQTHSKLAEQAEYKQAQSDAQLAVDTVDAADEKASRSTKEHRQKAADYDRDVIFTYLWKRGFGTKDYRAGRITRLLDRWVADHIGFEAQRRNYYMLLEIPKRLDAHVATLRDSAEKAMAELERLERDAEQAQGVTALEGELEAMRTALEAADREIEQEEMHYGQCLKQRDEFARLDDKYYLDALSILSESMQNQSLDQLRRRAALTQGYEDDSLVGQLGELRQEKQAIHQAQQATQRSSALLAERLHGLERVRRDFKRQRYDAPHSQFRNGAAVTDAVDDFMQGLIGVNELWRIVERSQQFIRRRTYPNYGRRPGAMRLPRGIRIPSNWGGMGGGGGLGGGMRFPRGGGGGGFKTGGGF